MFADAIAFALEWHRATMTAWSLGTWKKCNYPLGQTYKVGKILCKIFYTSLWKCWYDSCKKKKKKKKNRKKTFTPLPELKMLTHAPVV